MSSFCSRNYLFNRHVSLTTGFWNICFLWPWDSFEECWLGILLNTPQMGSNYFSIHLDCRFWGGDNKGELPFSSHECYVQSLWFISWPNVHNCPFLTSALSCPVFCKAFLLCTNPWTVLIPKPEKKLKWRMCLTFALFLTTQRHNPYKTTRSLYFLVCPRY